MVLEIKVSEGTIKALDRRSKAVRNVIKNAEDRRAVLQEIAEDQELRWLENQYGGKEYGGWAALKESTIKSRIALGFSSGADSEEILHRTGRAGSEVSDDAASPRINRASITWRMTDRIAIFHQTGTDRMVMRKWWEFDNQDEARNEEILTAWFMRIMSEL